MAADELYVVWAKVSMRHHHYIISFYSRYQNAAAGAIH
jgi:hypothetical protein